MMPCDIANAQYSVVQNNYCIEHVIIMVKHRSYFELTKDTNLG